MVGGGLIVFGLLLLLQNLELIYLDAQIFAAFAFLAVAAVVYRAFLKNHNYWVFIFASFLAYIGLIIFFDLIPGYDGQLSGALLLFGAGALFLGGYVRRRESWGLIIPAGLLLTLGFMVLFDILFPWQDEYLGAMFFGGIFLTFGYLFTIKDERNRLEWAKIPAFVSLFIAGIILMQSYGLVARLLFPVTLIGLGIYLIYQSSHKIRVTNK